MSPTTLVPAAPVAPKLDPRTAAFCAPGGLEVFSGVVSSTQIWTPDPFDVPAVHADAREAFARLLARASGPDAPPTGKSMLLLGDAGSGKTHLMRAFRTEAHTSGTGYCGYMQMLSRSDNYARYVLSHLVDSLEQPYKPGAATTGLARVARGLLDALDWVSDEDKRALCDDILDPPELAKLVYRIADIAVQHERFAMVDLNIIRAALYLLPNDGRIRPKVLNWLRCEDLPVYDREALGGLVPRPGPEWPLRTIVGLGHLMRAVHSAALVLLVDQLDEMIELAKTDPQPGEEFRRAINTLVDIADQVPNAVVVVGCITDLFVLNRGYLSKPKLDRLERDPEPIRLAKNRTAGEVRNIVARRLEVFYDAVDVEPDANNPLAPYTETDLAPLAGFSPRDVLAFCHAHREACLRARALVPPSGALVKWDDSQQVGSDFEKLWSDFHAAAKPLLIDEPKLAQLLGWAIGAASDEMANGVVFSADPDDRFVQVEVQFGNAAQKLLVAVCDRKAQGSGLANQLTEVTDRTDDDVPAVFVRSTEFPAATTVVGKRLAGLCAPKGPHRRTVVANADWRAMGAFRAFCAEHGQKPGFGAWRAKARPLAGLPALRAILELDKRDAAGPPKPLPPAPPLPPPGPAKLNPQVSPAPAPVAEKPATASAAIPLGRTRSAAPVAVELEPKSLCRHAAFLGGPGSGKTTAALGIIEHLLCSGVPAVLLDRKGDLARYADPTAWGAPNCAALRDAIDVQLFTPGAASGRPLALPVVPAGLAGATDADREQTAQFAAEALGAMMDCKGASKRPRVVILQKAIEALATTAGPMSVGALQKLVSDRDEALVSRFDGQFEDKHFKGLAEDLLVLNSRHKRLFEGGEPLNVDLLLGRGEHARPGRTRLSVVSTQFLGDATTVDFWVSQLLLAVDRWRAKNPAPEGKLQAVFLFDEADAYLPAVRVPATKGPMEGLLKRARSAGIGLFLATQSPGDLDYKCRDQVLTWFVGRVKEKVAIDKLKPMLEAKPGATDKLAEQKAGEFYMVRESDVQPVQVARNLIPTEQVPEDLILALARGCCTEAKPTT